jgi:hypothetical protein
MEHYSNTLQNVAIDHAHELGHNWSAAHTTGTCSGVYIMCPTIGANNNKWDNTTINSIINHKNTRSCLSQYHTTCGNFTAGTDNTLPVNLKSFVAYPNPANNMLTIEAQFTKSASVMVELRNIYGQLITSVSEESSSLLKKQISVEELSKGIYLLYVVADGQKWVNKVVKE